MLLIPSIIAEPGDWIWLPAAGKYFQITTETVETVRNAGVFLCWRKI